MAEPEGVDKIEKRATDKKTNCYIRLQISSNARYIAIARDIVYRFAREHGFSKRGAFLLKVICSEAVTNIIKHAYENQDDGPIFLELYINPSHAELVIRDLGQRGPVGADLTRDLSDYRESGLGLYLIGKLSDYHYFDRSGDIGTKLIVKKRIC